MATAEFSKFAGILSAALSQHHLLGFEIAQLEFHHPSPLVLFIIMIYMAALTSHSRKSGSRRINGIKYLKIQLTGNIEII